MSTNQIQRFGRSRLRVGKVLALPQRPS